MMDAAATRGLWLLPTFGRAATKVPKFLAACMATHVSTPGALLVEVDDYAANQAAYDALELPEGWRVELFDEKGTGPVTQAACERLCEGLDWVGWLADDLLPATPRWDVAAIESLNGWNFVTTDDSLMGRKRMGGAWVWSGELLRAVGWLYPPGLMHFYVDTAWETMAAMTGCWARRLDILVRHEHAMIVGPDSTTHGTHRYWDDDSRVYDLWRRADCMPAVERIIKLMQSRGLSMKVPKLDGIRVLLMSPSMNRQYDGAYVASLINSRDAVRNFGGELDWAEMPYCSDPALARNRCLGSFLRLSHTHIAFVDDDMGWRPQDLVRLLDMRLDFVAGAGPRKVSPISFAVNVSTEQGTYAPIQIDHKTGLIEATGVGMAFTILSRACAVRMSQVYKDLEFNAADGCVEPGVFTPLIHNKRYLSEDFAFCHRWRKLGGKVLVDPYVPLDHVGQNTWTGAWADALMAPQREAA